ncbi:glycosyltransferase family 2 protein [Roseofilum casamattae]|uniref:Glycosyltransferase family 2 protein n=1 Tax=Roseofilum casamattae BLCC-M143 TaxID=3022442 RepID=A0ABT7BY92_9CYAN|nr:glycosyltransferase family 2 protein [Roseofilum casamattae]MDJ1184167.1 glycosyltransferase family 2 protein [Roseofilum casamattae BLCC-M143]
MAVIPVLNEETTLTPIINTLQSYGIARIRVVDNGSTDRSVAVAKAAGAEVVLEPVPGYGRACWRGLQELPEGIEWILFCDGDGSDDLSCLPQFFRHHREYDFILGNRRATASGRSAMTFVQNFGNGLATLLMRLGWGYSYRDLGPLRSIRRSHLEAMDMEDRGFGWTVEMQVKAIESQLRICELPVGYRRRQGGRSKISGTLKGSVQAGSIILSTLGRLYLRRFDLQNLLLIFSSLLLILGAIATFPYGDFQQPGIVPQFWFGIAIMSVGFLLSWQLKSVSAMVFWFVAIASRALLFPMAPGDDIWRYLWEGYIQNLGFSPYAFAPDAIELIPYRTEWWPLMNHLHLPAIYPPLTQLGFRIIAAISVRVELFKLAFILPDLIICYLLARRFGYLKTVIYAWNPLIIYSFAGGAHYDSWFILPLVLGWLTWDKDKTNYLSAFFVGMSVAVKLISLPILGFLVWEKLRSRSALSIRLQTALKLLLIGLAPLALSYLFFISQGNVFNSDHSFYVYGRSAGFMSTLLPELWSGFERGNTIYPLLLALNLLVLIPSARTFFQFSQPYFFLLLIFSPIIHAWYFTWAVPFAVARPNLGMQWVSLSSFIYFALKHRQAYGETSWVLTESEWLWLWLPFIIGWMWSNRRAFSSSRS